MKSNINVPNINQPFNIKNQILNISNQNIHNLIYSSLFHWDEESITTAYLGSIYGKKYSINGICFQCGLSLSSCPNGQTPSLLTNARIASFNKHQEGFYSGSDFLLSYRLNKSRTYRFLFQAKAITADTKMNKGTWGGIFHKNLSQYKKLRTFALSNHAKPYYLFYVLNDSPHRNTSTLCPSHTTPYDTISLLISAEDIYNIYSKNSWGWCKDTFSQVIAPYTFPFTCLFKHLPKSGKTSNNPSSNPNSLPEFEPIFSDAFTDFMGDRGGQIKNSSEEKEIPSPDMPELTIDERLILASELKEKSMKGKKDYINKLEKTNDGFRFSESPDLTSINFILNLLEPNEFTTFSDISNIFNSTNSSFWTVRNYILSEKVLPEDAVKVVSKKEIISNSVIYLDGEFNSHYGYKNKVEVIEEFYPHLVITNGRIKIGEGPRDARYINLESLQEKLKSIH